MPSLKERFEQFMLSRKEVESVDQLLTQCVLKGRQRADYLAFNRCAVIEQKSLDIDPGRKIQRLLDDLAGAGSIVSTGLSSLGDLLSQIPNGAALADNLTAKITKGIDDILSKADKQTRDTKQTFVIPNAIGIVVILNDDAQILSPDIVSTKSFEMLRKRRPDGELRYVHNQVVVLISEAHLIECNEATTMIPMATIYSDAGNEMPLATTFAESLNKQWAEFNHAKYLESSELWGNFKTREPARVFNVRPQIKK